MVRKLTNRAVDPSTMKVCGSSACSDTSHLLDSYNWSSTSLGSTEAWSEQLRASVKLVMAAGTPMAVLHGPDLIQIYNDAFSVLMRDKHPQAFGQPMREHWPVTWNADCSILDQVQAGEAVILEGEPHPARRPGVGEDDWHRMFLSPLREETGGIWGILVTATLEQRCCDEGLNDNESRARAQLIGTTQATWEAGITGSALAPSPSWKAYTGQKDEEWQGFGWLDAVHPDDQPLVKNMWRERTALQQPFSMEHRLRTADDTWRWVNVRVVPVLNEAGAVCKWIGMNLDVHDRKQVEEQLRQSEARGAFLLGLSDALRSLTEAEQIEEVACRFLAEHLQCDRAYYVELSEEEGIARVGRHFQRSDRPSFTGEHSISTLAWCLPLLRSGQPLVVANVVLESLVPELNKAALIQAGLSAFVGIPLIKGSTLMGALSVTTDAPRCWTAAEIELLRETGERVWEAVERARAEARLRASEARFRGFAEASANVLWIADVRGEGLDYLSPAFERVFGVSPNAAMAGAQFVCKLVHPDDRALFLSIAPRALAGEAVVAHYRVIRPDQSVVHVRDTAFLIKDREGTLLQVAGLVQDVSDVEAARTALEGEKERFRILAEGVPQLVWRSDGQGRWIWASSQWLAYTGQTAEESLGFGWLEAIHPDDQAGALRTWSEKPACGRIKAEYRVRRASDGTWRWHTGHSAPIRRPLGPADVEECTEWLGTTTDIEGLKQMQQRQEVLVAELQHRTRNLIGVVSALAERTIDMASSLEDFSHRFSRRLSALSRVQGLLSHLSAGQRVTFDELLRAELTALGGAEGGGKVVLDGPIGVPLRSSAVQTLALALHELATNAIKYGALKAKEGRLTVHWIVNTTANNESCLHIDWNETGVELDNAALSSSRKGYGWELIERALPYQLGAETSLMFVKDGLRCSINLPIHHQ